MNALIDSKRSYDYPIKVVQFGKATEEAFGIKLSMS